MVLSGLGHLITQTSRGSLIQGSEQIGKTPISAARRNQAAIVRTEDRTNWVLKSLQAKRPWSCHILFMIQTPSLFPGVTTVYFSLPSFGSPVLLISSGTQCKHISEAWRSCLSIISDTLLSASSGIGPSPTCLLSQGVLKLVRLIFTTGLNDKSPNSIIGRHKQTWTCPRAELVEPWFRVGRSCKS